ncbi:MAG: undecaprenyl diphosphate synthase family protein [Methanomicrobiales archaeon]|nr:undecaprenyl diphosphate synthase family protein [Methanomicrobiales archaeon]
MFRYIYERFLIRGCVDIPHHICIMLSEDDMRRAPEKIVQVITWSKESGVKSLIFHIDTDTPDTLVSEITGITDSFGSVRVTLYSPKGKTFLHDGTALPDTIIAVGMSGREEIVRSVREIAEEGIAPDEIDEKMLESHLMFQYEPDFVIKTGDNHLIDFMIWQSVYSELFFTDVNWQTFRKVDFFRAIRDYQMRKRRYGR